MKKSTESWTFNIMSDMVRDVAIPMVESHFGKRCDIYQKDCPICEKYRQLDALLESPYKEKS